MSGALDPRTNATAAGRANRRITRAQPSAVDTAATDTAATAILRAGDVSLLLEFDTLEAAMSAHAHLLEHPTGGQLDTIAGARTVLLRFSDPRSAEIARGRLLRARFPLRELTSGREVVIDVVYQGEDLADAAAYAELSPEALIDWHTSQEWMGAFLGFAGFTYCVRRDRVLPSLGESVPGKPPLEETALGEVTIAGATQHQVDPSGTRTFLRHPTPRMLVPAGSVGLAGEFSGIYPRQAPGGWQLIGRTDAKLWDLSRPEPALIRPWDTVRYRQIQAEPITLAGRSSAEGSQTDGCKAEMGGIAGIAVEGSSTGSNATGTGDDGSAGYPALEILSAGLQSLIEDEGRIGVAHLGVSHAGVMDRAAALAANQAVGNPPGTPVIENLFGGFRARVLRPVTIAVTGAEVAITVRTESTESQGHPGTPARAELTRTVPLGAAFELQPNETVELGVPTAGIRTVIALRGGIDAQPVLGSVSTDTLSGIGPAPLEPGSKVLVAECESSSQPDGSRDTPPAAGTDSDVDTDTDTGSDVRAECPHGVSSVAPLPPSAAPTTLRVVFGPRDDWFDEAEKQRFLDQRWIVSPQSNRVGIRFMLDTNDAAARPLERIRDDELLSEGMAIGSVQVPPSGLPVLLMNDQAITGGYPIIAVIVSEDLSLAAQLYPGRPVRFKVADEAK